MEGPSRGENQCLFVKLQFKCGQHVCRRGETVVLWQREEVGGGQPGVSSDLRLLGSAAKMFPAQVPSSHAFTISSLV